MPTGMIGTILGSSIFQILSHFINPAPRVTILAVGSSNNMEGKSLRHSPRSPTSPRTPSPRTPLSVERGVRGEGVRGEGVRRPPYFVIEKGGYDRRDRRERDFEEEQATRVIGEEQPGQDMVALRIPLWNRNSLACSSVSVIR